MKRITAIVSRGNHTGIVLTPHKYAEGHFIVGKGGNTIDCTKKVSNADELESWVQRGYSIRMSAPGVAPSLYSPQNLKIERV